MKKYLKLSFDGATYFEYGDSSKQTVNLSIMTKDGTDNDLMAIFLTKFGVKNFKVASDTHVWNAVNVNGEWLTCDTINKRNGFGVINNWTLIELWGTYRELPF